MIEVPEFETQERLTSGQKYYRKRKGHNTSKSFMKCLNKKCRAFIGTNVFPKYKDECPFCGGCEWEVRK